MRNTRQLRRRIFDNVQGTRLYLVVTTHGLQLHNVGTPIDLNARKLWNNQPHFTRWAIRIESFCWFVPLIVESHVPIQAMARRHAPMFEATRFEIQNRDLLLRTKTLPSWQCDGLCMRGKFQLPMVVVVVVGVRGATATYDGSMVNQSIVMGMGKNKGSINPLSKTA